MQAPCCVCFVATTKYCCPGCCVRYCSLSCCKKHKVECIPKEALSTNIVTLLTNRGYRQFARKDDLFVNDNEFDTVPLQKLKLLGKSEDIKLLLQNSHLRRILLALDQTEKKDDALKEYMQEPLFVEFVDRCLLIEEKENV